MRIAFLCKRHYTGKDVILDLYGRLYEIPSQLARTGHEVRAWCLDYYGSSDGEYHLQANDATQVVWSSYATGGVRTIRLAAYPAWLYQQLVNFKPDIVIGASDIPHVSLAAWLGQKIGVPYVVDLYDNFESFGQARIPGFKKLLARAVHHANLVITVGHALQEKVSMDYAPANTVLVMPNGINPHTFYPGNRIQARQTLNLPIHAKLIGTAGGLSRMKGLETVYAAWQHLEKMQPDLHLVLAGTVEKKFQPPSGPRVHYLGELSTKRVADLFRALDVGIIPLRDSSFGRYCFPQKAYEMLSCQLPVVAANIGEMASLFSAWPEILFSPDSSQELIKSVLRQLKKPIFCTLPVENWEKLNLKLSRELELLPILVHQSSNLLRN